MHRLFLALPCPNAFIEQLEDVQEGIDGVRWVPEENLHCTLRFIGEVERPVAEDIANALDGFSGKAPTVRLAGVGIFDNGTRGQLWARLAPKPPLEALHAKLDRLVQRCGLKPEGRAYLPHITLGRWSGGAIDAADWAARNAALTSQDTLIDRVILYESQLGRHGPHYEAVREVMLRQH